MPLHLSLDKVRVLAAAIVCALALAVGFAPAERDDEPQYEAAQAGPADICSLEIVGCLSFR